MVKLVEIIPYIFGGILIFSLGIGLNRLLIAVHNFVAKAVYFVIRPIPWFYERLLDKLENLRCRIFGQKEERFTAFGGTGRLVIMIVLAALSAVMLVHICRTEEATEFLVMDFMFKTPPLFLMSFVFSLFGDFSPFEISAMVESVLISALTIAFFHKHDDLHAVVRIIYGLIFLVFFLLITWFIPEEVYALLMALPSVTAELLGSSVPVIGMGVFGRIISIALGILSIIGLVVVAYITVALIALTIRELVASVVFSILPTFAIGLVLVPVLEILMENSSETAQIIVLAALVVGATIVLDLWRSSDEDDPYKDYGAEYTPLIVKLALNLHKNRNV